MTAQNLTNAARTDATASAALVALAARQKRTQRRRSQALAYRLAVHTGHRSAAAIQSPTVEATPQEAATYTTRQDHTPEPYRPSLPTPLAHPAERRAAARAADLAALAERQAARAARA